jgi:hypothetical protein
MNILSRDQQIAAISALTEGCSIRATERLTGIHRDTIMRLGVRVGDGCAALHDEMMRFVQVNRLELDEFWSYVGKKQRRVKPTDSADFGDQYVFIGIDATRKAIVCYLVGKRDGENADVFLADLRQRIANRPEISSDGFSAYPDAVERFRPRLFLRAAYQAVPGRAWDRCGPPLLAGCGSRRTAPLGNRRAAEDQHVICRARQLSVRMASRRFTRLTNGFSKKLQNHVAAVSLYGRALQPMPCP